MLWWLLRSSLHLHLWRNNARCLSDGLWLFWFPGMSGQTGQFNRGSASASAGAPICAGGVACWEAPGPAMGS